MRAGVLHVLELCVLTFLSSLRRPSANFRLRMFSVRYLFSPMVINPAKATLPEQLQQGGDKISSTTNPGAKGCPSDHDKGLSGESPTQSGCTKYFEASVRHTNNPCAGCAKHTLSARDRRSEPNFVTQKLLPRIQIKMMPRMLYVPLPVDDWV